MKRLMSLLLAVLLMLSFAACGTSAPAEVPPTEETATETAVETVEEDETAVYDEVNLVVATGFSETESGGANWTYFKEKLEELSGGKVTLTIYYGGTLCAATEELGMIESGAIDMCCLRSYPADLPLTTFPETTNLGIEETVRYYSYVFYENEESASYLAEELAEHNGVYIGTCWSGGGQVCMSTVDVKNLEDMGKYACGTTNFETAWKSLGLNNINSSVSGPDMYTGLNSGLIQWQILSIGPVFGMKLYEVCDYGVIMGMYGAGNNMVINADTWASLNDDTKALIQEAAKDTMEHSIQMSIDEWDNNIATIEGYGVEFCTLPQEDMDAFAEALWTASCDTAYQNCVAVGKGEEMAAIIGAAAEFYGKEWNVPTV